MVTPRPVSPLQSPSFVQSHPCCPAPYYKCQRILIWRRVTSLWRCFCDAATKRISWPSYQLSAINIWLQTKFHAEVPFVFCEYCLPPAKAPKLTSPAKNVNKIPSRFWPPISLREQKGSLKLFLFCEEHTDIVPVSDRYLLHSGISKTNHWRDKGQGRVGVWKGACSVVGATLAEILYVRSSMRKFDTVTDKLPHYSPAWNNNSGFYQE